MKNLRPIEIEKCAVCGEEFDRLIMHEVFTGRVQYICPACKSRGSSQVKARRKEWRKTAKGKAIIELCEKNK